MLQKKMQKMNCREMHCYCIHMQKKISNGRAAEILGISKLDLIDLYGKMGFCYFDQTMDELDKDLETFESLGLSGVTV